MIQIAFLFLIYPFWFASGLFPIEVVPKKPSWPTRVYAHAAFWVMAALKWYVFSEGTEFSTFALQLLWWWLLTFVLTVRYQIPLLLGWAATDVVGLITGDSYPVWDTLLLIILFLRNYRSLSKSEG